MDNKWIDYYYGQAYPDVQDGGNWGDMVEDVYSRVSQIGRGKYPIYRAPVLQKGYGIGNLFKSMARTVMPALKEGMKTLGKTALQTGMDVMQDVASGENFKTAAKKRLKQNSLGLLNDMKASRKTINKKPRQRNPISSKKARKRKHQEISDPIGEANIFTKFEKRKKH